MNTEELLYLLLWGAEKLTRPTFRNLTDSYESWAVRNGFHDLPRLERKGLLERAPNTAARIYRLTELGRLQALGGRDPEAKWNRVWDRKWRLVIFDIPETRRKARLRLRRFLREQGFGYLQQSVWISPDPLGSAIQQLSAKGEDVESFLTLEAQPCSGESDQSVVSGAWDFDRINDLYRKCLKVLGELPDEPLQRSQPSSLEIWARNERLAWQQAIRLDPMLPDALLPEGYLGKKTWQMRQRVLRQAGRSAQGGMKKT